jgi:hypothetical protein
MKWPANADDRAGYFIIQPAPSRFVHQFQIRMREQRAAIEAGVATSSPLGQ